jgi:hypothetical protein
VNHYKIFYNGKKNNIITVGDYMQTKTINVLGQEIIFTPETCKCYEDILQVLANQATSATLKQMNALQDADFTKLFATIWVELEQAFDMSDEFAGALEDIDWEAEVAKSRKEDPQE